MSSGEIILAADHSLVRRLQRSFNPEDYDKWLALRAKAGEMLRLMDDMVEEAGIEYAEANGGDFTIGDKRWYATVEKQSKVTDMGLLDEMDRVGLLNPDNLKMVLRTDAIRPAALRDLIGGDADAYIEVREKPVLREGKPRGGHGKKLMAAQGFIEGSSDE